MRFYFQENAELTSSSDDGPTRPDCDVYLRVAGSEAVARMTRQQNPGSPFPDCASFHPG
jgi:hypothetical protein